MVEITPSYLRIPIHNKSKKDKTIRTITISEDRGIKALYSIERKIILTFLFNKDKKFGWTVKKAKQWIKEHKASVEHIMSIGGLKVRTVREDLIDLDSLSDDVELIETHIQIHDRSDEDSKKHLPEERKKKKKTEDDEGTHHTPEERRKKKKKKPMVTY